MPRSSRLTGRSLLPILSSNRAVRVVARPATRVPWPSPRSNGTRGAGLTAPGYPMRAIRTHDFLYVRNFAPDRWPTGRSRVHLVEQDRARRRRRLSRRRTSWRSGEPGEASPRVHALRSAASGSRSSTTCASLPLSRYSNLGGGPRVRGGPRKVLGATAPVPGRTGDPRMPRPGSLAGLRLPADGRVWRDVQPHPERGGA